MLQHQNILVITLGDHDIKLREIPKGMETKSETFTRKVNEGKLNEKVITEEKYYIQHKDDPAGYDQPNVKYIEKPYGGNKEISILDSRPSMLYINQHYEDFNSVLKFPMIEPALDHLFKNSIIPHQIWWAVTDQPKGTPPNHRNRDTVNNPLVLEKRIKKLDPRLNDSKFAKIRFEKVVTQLDTCYEQIEQNILEAAKQTGLNQEMLLDSTQTRFYLLIQGGIDAINTSLLLKLTEWRPDSVQLQKGEGTPIRETSFPELINKNFRKRLLMRLIEDQKFDDAVLQMVHEEDKESPIPLLSRFLHSVLHFEWINLTKQEMLPLDEVLKNMSNENKNEDINNLLIYIEQLRNPQDYIERIKQMREVIGWLIQQKKHLMSAIYLNIMKEYALVSLVQEVIGEYDTESFQVKIRNNRQLFDWISVQKVNIKGEVKKVSIDRPTTRNLGCIIQYLINNNPDNPTYSIIRELTQAIDSITKNIRNNFLHNGEGDINRVAKDRIKQALHNFDKKEIFQPKYEVFPLASKLMLRYLNGEFENQKKSE